MAGQDKLLSHIKQKPYFVGKDFALYLGDSIELLKQLPENSTDVILILLYEIKF